MINHLILALAALTALAHTTVPMIVLMRRVGPDDLMTYDLPFMLQLGTHLQNSEDQNAELRQNLAALKERTKT